MSSANGIYITMENGPNDDFVTDTVIITSKTQDVCSAPLFDQIVDKVQDDVVDESQVYGSKAVQVIALTGFKRVLVISPTYQISRKVKALGEHFPECKFGYSIIDHVPDTKSMHMVTRTKTFLEVPELKTVFLISPPASPPPDFDYSRLEDWPNRDTGHGHGESVETPDPKPKSSTDSAVNDKKADSYTKKKVLDNGRFKIFVESSDDGSESPTDLHRVKTSMPPVSTFDDIED